MKKMIDKDKGITLISLVVTIIVILILASVATYSGINAVKLSEFNRFTTELEIMQTEVNTLYEKYKNGETINGKEVLTYGTDIETATQQIKQQANMVFTQDASGITDQIGYKYYNKETIDSLGIEGVEQEFFVNIETRNIVSYYGMEYEGKSYYTLDQIPNGLYNVEYKEENAKPTFNVDVDLIGENKYKISINDIEYEGYNNIWKVRYQINGSENWNTSDELSFFVEQEGDYNIQIKNGDIESAIKSKHIGYIQDGLVLHYDGIVNTRNGNNTKAIKWEDLSGNKNDGQLNGFEYNEESGWGQNGLICNGSNNSFTTADVNLKQNSSITIEMTFKENKYVKLNNNNIIFTADLIWKSFCFHTWYDDSSLMLNGIIYIGGNATDGGDNNRFVPSDMNSYRTTEGKTDNIFYVYESDTKQAKLYINSNKVATKIYNTEPLEIKYFESGTANYKTYNNILIYNRALTDEEIQLNYEIDKNRFNIE